MPYADPDKRRERERNRARKWRAVNLEKARKLTREYMYSTYHSDPQKRAKRLAANKKYAQQNKEKVAAGMRRRKLMRKFGISVEQYDAMFARQRGVCALCRRPSARIRLSVDHDHRTNMVRGLLCTGCNRLLGRVEARMTLIDLCLYLGRQRALGLSHVAA